MTCTHKAWNWWLDFYFPCIAATTISAFSWWSECTYLKWHEFLSRHPVCNQCLKCILSNDENNELVRIMLVDDRRLAWLSIFSFLWIISANELALRLVGSTWEAYYAYAMEGEEGSHFQGPAVVSGWPCPPPSPHLVCATGHNALFNTYVPLTFAVAGTACLWWGGWFKMVVMMMMMLAAWVSQSWVELSRCKNQFWKELISVAGCCFSALISCCRL